MISPLVCEYWKENNLTHTEDWKERKSEMWQKEKEKNEKKKTSDIWIPAEAFLLRHPFASSFPALRKT